MGLQLIQTRPRLRQDIAFPRSSVFPEETVGFTRRGQYPRRASGRPFGVPGADVELGDVGDAIGGGSEVIEPGGEPGFPGGPTVRFPEPEPFPEGPPAPEGPTALDRGLAVGRTGVGLAQRVEQVLGGGKQVKPATAPPVEQDVALGGATAAPGTIGEALVPLGGRLDPLTTELPGTAHQVPGFGDVFGEAPDFGTPGIELGDVGDFQLQAPTGPASAQFELEGSPQIDAAAPSGDFEIGGDQVLGGLGAAAGIAATAMGDRPNWQKALLSTGDLVGAFVPGVSLAKNLALFGESMSGDASDDQKVAATGNLVASGLNLVMPGLGLPLQIGLGVDSIARMFQPPQPPYGASWTQYKSTETGRQLAENFPSLLESLTDPISALGVAVAGRALSPHGEFKIMHDSWGSGGDYAEETSPAMREKIEQIASTGDPQLLREFLQGVYVAHGETGAAQRDWALTDLYRRTLVNLLPETHPIRQEAMTNPDAVFGPTPDRFSAAGGLTEYLSGDVLPPDLVSTIDRLRSDWNPTPGISTLFRDPGFFQLSPEQRSQLLGTATARLPAAPTEGGYNMVQTPTAGGIPAPTRIPTAEGGYQDLGAISAMTPEEYWRLVGPMEQWPNYYSVSGDFSLGGGG